MEKLSNGDGSAVKKSWEEILVRKSLWRLKNVLAPSLEVREHFRSEETGIEEKII